MSIVDRLKSLLTPPERTGGRTEFIYVFLPGDIDPLDRGSRYEDALEAELRLAGIGWVSGGGSQLGPERPDGTSSIEFCGLDVDVIDVAAGRKLLRQHLPALRCPPGTELHYSQGDLSLQDEYDGQTWVLAQPRDRLHPAFGI